MKKIKTLITITCLLFFGGQFITAQTINTSQEKVYKISKSEVPTKVKETLSKYSNYTISKEATFTKKSNSPKLYTFKIKKGAIEHYLLIDENGKIRGIKDQEGDNK